MYNLLIPMINQSINQSLSCMIIAEAFGLRVDSEKIYIYRLQNQSPFRNFSVFNYLESTRHTDMEYIHCILGLILPYHS